MIENCVGDETRMLGVWAGWRVNALTSKDLLRRRRRRRTRAALWLHGVKERAAEYRIASEEVKSRE